MGTIYGYDTASTNWEELYSAIVAGSIFNPFTLLMNLASYILLGIGMYTIAKRRGITHAWLAWIPFGQTWLLGCISDQYRYVTRREEKNKRKVMLVLEILTAVACAAMIVILFRMIPDLFRFVGSGLESDFNQAVNDGTAARLMQSAGLFSTAVLITTGLRIALAVLMYMSYYDLFASCDPNNKTIFLVLGIFFGIAMSIFVFACRKKDYGMPPRRDAVQPPVWTPPQQTWQPPQPPAEPWEQNRE